MRRNRKIWLLNKLHPKLVYGVKGVKDYPQGSRKSASTHTPYRFGMERQADFVVLPRLEVRDSRSFPSKTKDFAGFTVYLCCSWEMCFPKVTKITKGMVCKYRKSYDHDFDLIWNLFARVAFCG